MNHVSSSPLVAEPPSAASALELHEFGVAFGERTILDGLSATLPTHGLTVLLGPAGGGKSTLLRTLAGLNDTHPSLATWGEVRLLGEAWAFSGRRHTAGPHERPKLVVQHARFFLDTVAENLIGGLPDRAAHERSAQLRLVREALTDNGLEHLVPVLGREAVSLSLGEQRCLSVVRAGMAGPALLFTDEPTAGLDDAGAEAVLRLLRLQAERRSVLFVTHHQRLARLAGGTTLLLANGRIQEAAPTERFFSMPSSEAGRQFVETGSCRTTLPEADGAPDVNEANPPTPDSAATPAVTPIKVARSAPQRYPRGFSWIIPGKLGGLPRPGVIDDFDDDLQGLARLGITLLVTLEEQRSVDSARMATVGIQSVHFPIPDMGVPRLEDALRLCAEVQSWLAAGNRVAYHCLAGHGRTGTLLASQLIVTGQSARVALEQVRAVNARYVQSDAQVAFLRKLELVVQLARAESNEGNLLDDTSRAEGPH